MFKKAFPVFIIVLGLPFCLASADDTAKPVVPETTLTEHPYFVMAQSAVKVDVTYLGVTAQEISSAMSSQLKLPEGVGLLVTHVAPGSPASDAGLLKHDLLHKLDDQLLINYSQFTTLIRLRQPGDSVSLTVIRGGDTITIEAALSEQQVPRHSLTMREHPNRWIAVPNTHPYDVLSVAPAMPDQNILHGQVLKMPTHQRVFFPEDFTAHARDRYKLRILDDGYKISITKLTDDGPRITVEDADGNIMHDGAWDPATDPEASGLPDGISDQINDIVTASRSGGPLQIKADTLEVTTPPQVPEP